MPCKAFVLLAWPALRIVSSAEVGARYGVSAVRIPQNGPLPSCSHVYMKHLCSGLATPTWLIIEAKSQAKLTDVEPTIARCRRCC
ncbi:hypothetical protein J3E68DRAFT_421192 [Trichoderma sp. SZMC 28012]